MSDAFRNWIGGGRYAAHNERENCVCGTTRQKVQNQVWRVTNKTSDLIYPEFMFRCPECSSYSAVNLYFPVEKYVEHDVGAMFIDTKKQALNEARFDWVLSHGQMAANAVLYDLGAGEGCFSHVFATRLPESRVFAIEGDAKVEAKFYGSLANVRFVPQYIEPFLKNPTDDIPKADLMVLTDVMEHVISPEDVLGLIAGALAPGGLIYLTVPDARTFSDPVPEHVLPHRLDWQRANRTCQHLWLLTPTMVETLMAKTFDVIEVSGFETDIRRDSVYTTVLARRRPEY
ncbi:class I SAM-dependent methyltransferase [Mesorhizobium sp. A556]